MLSAAPVERYASFEISNAESIMLRTPPPTPNNPLLKPLTAPAKLMRKGVCFTLNVGFINTHLQPLSA
jgi:hypothetical protein